MEGGLWWSDIYHSKFDAVQDAITSYNQLCANDKKSRGFLVNEYEMYDVLQEFEDPINIGCIFEASRFIEQPETVPSGATMDEFYIDDMEG